MAALFTGGIYFWGQGVAVDYKRALAAYKIGAEGGNASCQYNLGYMLQQGRGVDSPDYKQALVWFEKAAAQDHPRALNSLGVMARSGLGQKPSYRRAREFCRRALELGDQQAMAGMQILKREIQQVLLRDSRALCG